MSPAELYYRRAAECLQLANRLRGQEERGCMVELAACWDRLAEHAHEREGDSTLCPLEAKPLSRT
jgi:hypothetical protein